MGASEGAVVVEASEANKGETPEDEPKNDGNEVDDEGNDDDEGDDDEKGNDDDDEDDDRNVNK